MRVSLCVLCRSDGLHLVHQSQQQWLTMALVFCKIIRLRPGIAMAKSARASIVIEAPQRTIPASRSTTTVLAGSSCHSMTARDRNASFLNGYKR